MTRQFFVYIELCWSGKGNSRLAECEEKNKGRDNTGSGGIL